MVCYIVPLVATFFALGLRRGINQGFMLVVMLIGASLFGVVDHMWHGELFLIGEAWMMDLALGVVITASVTGMWGILAHKEDLTESFNRINQRLGFLKR